MKKILFLCFFIVLSAMSFANLRTVEQAAVLAADALNDNASVGSRRAPATANGMQLYKTLYKRTLDLEVNDGSRQMANKRRIHDRHSAAEAVSEGRQIVHIEHADDEPALYIFNNDNGGWAVISADTRSVDLLCYNETGQMDDTSLNPALRWWLNRFVEEISSLTDEEEPADTPSRAPQAAQVAAISPLLGGIAYAQGTPFNNMCPLDELRNNQRCVTGCVATAATQIMRFWQYPTHGNLRKKYQWMDMDNAGYSHGYLSADFASATYDYANMRTDSYGSYTAAQATAVATLMHHAGVAAEMSYQATGSGAYNEVMANAFVTYFGYALDGHLSTYNGNTVVQIKASINADLDAGRPVFMGGSDANAGGHAFVCDGRNSSGNLHFNWGWAGLGNCYTPITSMHPDRADKSYYFTSGLEATVGLRPDEDCLSESYIYKLVASDELPYSWAGQSIEAAGTYNGERTVRENSCDTVCVLQLSLLPAGASRGGYCGNDLIWYLNSDETTLTFEGTGEMWDFSYIDDANNTVPWFDAHSTITNVIMPEGMLSTGDFAFIKCTNVASFTLPSSLIWLGKYTFALCTFSSITLPTAFYGMDDAAFALCANLTSITIPENVEYTGADPFAGSGLTTVVWNAKNCLSKETFATTPFYSVGSQITSFTFGGNVKFIPAALCYGMSQLTSITIPASVTKIDQCAFINCSNIRSITIPQNVVSIGINTFYGCSKLTAVVWNAKNCGSATTAANSPLYDVRTQITSITIGSNVTKIPSFLCNNMTNLASIRSESIAPPTLPINAKTNVPTTVSVVVPCGRIPAYRAALNWSDFTNYSTFGDEFPFSLTAGVQSEGTGSAAVTTAPDCNTNIATITATPAAHYHFLRWSDESAGGISVGTVRDVTLTDNATYTAVFEEDTKYTLTINNDGNGTASADKASYYEGETAILTITPDRYYRFAAWTGEDNENITQIDDTHYEYIIGATNRTFTATFEVDYIGGNCEEDNGENLTWQIDNGMLTISGSGNMEPYADAADMPWYAYRNEITAATVSERADQTPLFQWLETQDGLNVTIQRTLYADGYYNSLCLPFDLSASQLEASLPGAALFSFTDAAVVAGSLDLQLSPASNLEAGRPYLVRFPEANPDIVNPVFNNVQIAASAGQTVGTDNVRFVGILKPNMMTADYSDQLMVGANNQLYWADRNAAMRGFRAYFDVQTSGSSPLRRGMPARVVEKAQTPTDIQPATQKNTARKYIVNSMFIIERNGKRYNAQGRLIIDN